MPVKHYLVTAATVIVALIVYDKWVRPALGM